MSYQAPFTAVSAAREFLSAASGPAPRAAAATLDCSTPVLLLGGKENALSIARHLGRLGIAVRVSGPSHNWAGWSRYCTELLATPAAKTSQAYWAELLLGSERSALDGHIVFPCSDEAIEFVATHREALAGRYLLDDATPSLQTALLNKERTLALAQAAGIPTPRYWTITEDANIDRVMAAVTLPAMVKPVHSHKFAQVFGKKLFIVEEDRAELADKVRLARRHGLDVMVVELIPGPDELLSSYYTYVTPAGERLFRFTKRVIRRFPVNAGIGCYHVTEWLPETAAAGQKLFDAIGFRGLGNVEFKRDPRDGKLKIIEVNARFTAAHELLLQAGAPIDLILYCHLTGQPLPRFETYEQQIHLWYPQRDLMAFLELWRRGELTPAQWLKSIVGHKRVYPLFDWRDPLPSCAALAGAIRRILRGHA